MDMEQMIAFWEDLVMVENTPVVEQFASKRRESSLKVDKLLNTFGENLKRNDDEDINTLYSLTQAVQLL